MNLSDLKEKGIPDLNTIARDLGVQGISGLRKQDLIFRILQAQVDRHGQIFARACSSACPTASASCARPSTATCRARTTSTSRRRRSASSISGPATPSRARCGRPRRASATSRSSRSSRSTSRRPRTCARQVFFDNLTPLYPDAAASARAAALTDLSTRVMDLLTPIGKGQRGLIVAPPRTGKTMLLQSIANAIAANHPEVVLIVLLIDERPEEVTDMVSGTSRARSSPRPSTSRRCATSRWRRW